MADPFNTPEIADCDKKNQTKQKFHKTKPDYVPHNHPRSLSHH